jgi:hypothetical protein
MEKCPKILNTGKGRGIKNPGGCPTRPFPFLTWNCLACRVFLLEKDRFFKLAWHDFVLAWTGPMLVSFALSALCIACVPLENGRAFCWLPWPFQFVPCLLSSWIGCMDWLHKKGILWAEPFLSRLTGGGGGAVQGFFGCRHFSQANKLLEKEGLPPIDWQL